MSRRVPAALPFTPLPPFSFSAGQAKHTGTLGDLVLSTLHLLERTGGPHAFLNIK